jgi:heme-degrading monooxygenase HmoA
MFMIIRHKVEDFAQWKQVFDEHSGIREAFGSKGGILFRNIKDPSEIMVLLEWRDLERAREFIASKGKESMEPTQLHEHARVEYLDEAERFRV